MSVRQRRVSVIVPTRDRPEMLRQALASIRALEGPDLSFEILVGDNGQDAQTRNVAEEFGAIYIPVLTKGAGAARNAGLRAATGEFIAFLDDDDVWLPTHLKRHIEILDTQPDVEGVIGQIITTDLELRQSDAPWPNMLPDDRDELLKTMLSGYYPQIGGTVARASVRDSIGLFDETLLGDQDWDWQLRIARRRALAFAEAPCVLFRQRPSGSYDALRLRRLRFARRVFLRHALPEWRLWKSPREFAYSYRCVIQQYYDYFVDAAVSRADENDRRGALRAIFSAIRVFPLRSAYHLARMKPLGKAFLSAAWTGRRDLAKQISGSSFDRF
jgi:glycosyltransferase involved in cell wall biosynthesis